MTSLILVLPANHMQEQTLHPKGRLFPMVLCEQLLATAVKALTAPVFLKTDVSFTDLLYVYQTDPQVYAARVRNCLTRPI